MTRPAIQTAAQTTRLHRCRMVVDGNAHRPDLCTGVLPQPTGALISEALLPQIRTVATLIAAQRHDFSRKSPDCFTDEADFFAARILVLGVRRFHLDITLKPMLKAANQRAQAFARKHNLPFEPADMQMYLHSNRPANLLIIETETEIAATGNLIADSMAFAARLPRLPL